MSEAFQHYWRCAHYPRGLENFFTNRTTCEWGCHTTKLSWYHGGMHPTPKSWGTPSGIDFARST
jgi:hypothetical protein